MVLYTDASMVRSSGKTLKTEQQMETEIITAYAEANDALADSGISATVNVVHTARASAYFSSLFPLYREAEGRGLHQIPV